MFYAGSGHREYTGTESRKQIKCSPRFYSVPHDRIAEEGETVRMTASARGMPSPWTTWTKVLTDHFIFTYS